MSDRPAVPPAPWTTWDENDPPHMFTSDEARENSEVLLRLLSYEFLSSSRRTEMRHPIRQNWMRSTAHSFLLLNALADDLRLLMNKPALTAVLRDLRDEHTYESARHTLRVAALFERAVAGSVLRFIDARNDTAPDFVVAPHGKEVPVEAKLLMESEIEKLFNKTARRIEIEINSSLKDVDDELGIYIVVPDAAKPPLKQELANALHDLILKPGVTKKFEHCRMHVERLPVASGLVRRRVIYILAPIHEKDYLRIRGPARQASRQLRTAETESDSGILALGLKGHDPSSVFNLLHRSMQQGKFRGVGLILLTKSGLHFGPSKRTVIDLLEIRKNPSAKTSIADQILLRPVDFVAKLTAAEPGQTSQPAYRFASSTATISDASVNSQLWLPDIRRVANELLE